MSSVIKTLKIQKPDDMCYEVSYVTDKDKRKFIERVKRIVRGSREYKDYIRFLKDHMDMNKCAFIPGIKHTNENKIRIELHHEPFTLDDIVRIVIDKQLANGCQLNDTLVADEVAELHYNNEVGLIPLSKTVHEVIHSDTNKLFIPINMCYGNFRQFLEDYQDYITDEDNDILDRLETKIQLTKNITPESFEALRLEFEYLDVQGFEDAQQMELDEHVEEVA